MYTGVYRVYMSMTWAWRYNILGLIIALKSLLHLRLLHLGQNVITFTTLLHFTFRPSKTIFCKKTIVAKTLADPDTRKRIYQFCSLHEYWNCIDQSCFLASWALKLNEGTVLEVIIFSFLFKASVIKDYGVYWDEISVTLNCKSSVFSASLL